MDSHAVQQLLYEYAIKYEFPDFNRLFSEIDAQILSKCPDAYMMRAQIKLMAADSTALDDMRLADEMNLPLEFPRLSQGWMPQDPNAFIVFNKDKGSLAEFSDTLPEVARLMQKHYGAMTHGIVRQIMSEIMYFTCQTSRAVAIAGEQFGSTAHNCVWHISSGYALFRSHMAEGNVESAQQVLLEIIDTARRNENNPSCSRAYRTVRDWVNLTTGWGGDMPRYHKTPDSVVLPVLEDRTAAIQSGIDELGPTERPFVEYAKLRYKNIYTVRQLFMDIYYSVYYFRAANMTHCRVHFNYAYTAAYPNGLIMPFIEYGMQIVPMLEYICNSADESDGYDRDWLEQIIISSREYEESLTLFRE